MVSVSTGAGAYQSLDRIRQRVEYEPEDLFGGGNAALEFDELLVELEEESRGIFVTLWGDETPLTETDRVDTIQPTDNAAIPLVYPINNVSQVEYKQTQAADWQTLDADWYTHTGHRLILSDRANANSLRARSRRGNPLTNHAERTTWGQLAAKLRVTYDRGFGDTPPADILSVQIQLINNMLRQLKKEETIDAASPEEFGTLTESREVVTDEVRNRIDDVTSPGMSTLVI